MKVYLLLLEALISQFGSMELKMLAKLAKVNPQAIANELPKDVSSDICLIIARLKGANIMECAQMRMGGGDFGGSIPEAGAYCEKLFKEHKVVQGQKAAKASQ